MDGLRLVIGFLVTGAAAAAAAGEGPEAGADRSVCCGTVDEAWSLISDITRGKLADVCVLTTDVAEGSYIGEALSLVGKRGRVVVTAIGHPEDTSMSGSLLELTLYEKQIRGALYGSSNAAHDIPRLVELYNSGHLKLDELITREYTLDQINEGYDDMRSGRNIRGLIRF